MAKRNKSKKNEVVAANVDATNNSPETFSLTEGNMNENNGTATVEAPTAPVATETKASKSKGKAPAKLADFKVKQTVELHPSQVEFVEKFRGRAKLASEQTQCDIADSMRSKGQQQAIQVREKQGEPGKYECIFGNTRLLGANKIVNGYTTDGGKKEVAPNAAFRIRAEVVDCDDDTAVLANIVENAHRTAVSPIGNALNQKMLREEHGMSDVAIAKLYDYSSSASVSRLKKLLELEEEYQNSVEDGTLTQGAAFLLADVPAGEARKAVWLACVDKCKGEDSIGSTPMVEAIKAWRKAEKEKAAPVSTEGESKPEGSTEPTGEGESKPEGSTEPAGKSYALTLKAFKDLVTGIASDAACPAKVAEGMGIILSTLSGETSDRDFAQWFAANLNG